MAKSISLTYHLSKLISSSSTKSSLFLSQFPSRTFSFSFSFSSSTTRYPLQYELIINRPPPYSQTRPPPVRRNAFPEPEPDEPSSEPELKLDSWVDRKLAEPGTELDKGKRKYYNKRRKRMYGGSDSDDESNRRQDEAVIELKPDVVEFHTLHKREEELHFYDAFSYPWEKDKHYKMVYQLEKKYFPDQCLDKAFLQPGEENQKKKKKREESEDKKTVFFEGRGEENEEKVVVEGSRRRSKDVSEKKVEEFFKGLKNKKKDDNGVVGDGNGEVEPFFSSRRTGLPPVWDTPHGTVLLINKPKGKELRIV